MATKEVLQQLSDILEGVSSVDMENLKRPSLGQESLVKEIESREERVRQLVELARSYAPLVHDEIVHIICSNLQTIRKVMANQAALQSPDYLANRTEFLNQLDNHMEEANRWKPVVAGAAMLARGLLEDEGLRHESERALDTLRQNTEETLAKIQSEAEKSIQGAKDLAEEIEAKARRTAAKISVQEAQQQFLEASRQDAKRVKSWAWLAGLAVCALIATPLLFIAFWPLPQTDQWPVALYHTILRVLLLSAIAGMAAFAFRMFRAHLHIAEKNRHRLRVANSVESLVQSALEPAQRDLILAKLTDSIVSFGDSGLVQQTTEDRSGTISGDLIGRVVAAISSKGNP